MVTASVVAAMTSRSLHASYELMRQLGAVKIGRNLRLPGEVWESYLAQLTAHTTATPVLLEDTPLPRQKPPWPEPPEDVKRMLEEASERARLPEGTRYRRKPPPVDPVARRAAIDAWLNERDEEAKRPPVDVESKHATNAESDAPNPKTPPRARRVDAATRRAEMKAWLAARRRT
jgi:hypothetical protein